MAQGLPEGISYNLYSEGDFEVEYPFETLKVWTCKECDLSLETLLIGSEGRYQGKIITPNNNFTVWQGKLPKVKEKAIKFLEENLDKKVERHLEGH
jgi:hypothetical protein